MTVHQFNLLRQQSGWEAEITDHYLCMTEEAGVFLPEFYLSVKKTVKFPGALLEIGVLALKPQCPQAYQWSKFKDTVRIMQQVVMLWFERVVREHAFA